MGHIQRQTDGKKYKVQKYWGNFICEQDSISNQYGNFNPFSSVEATGWPLFLIICTIINYKWIKYLIVKNYVGDKMAKVK